MQGFRCAPMDEVRVGLIGLGGRGSHALERLQTIPGVRIVAICDCEEDRVAENAAKLKAAGVSGFKSFTGSKEAWKGLCELDSVDAVYIATSWQVHAQMGSYALRSGKHAFIEVPSAMTIDECWELVEESERSRRHCMQLENCLYGEAECLALAMCRERMFGELLYGECGYLHDRRRSIFNGIHRDHWRMKWNIAHRGDQYPTHGLGPICQCMDVNRGDSLDFLVSVDTKQAGYEAYAARKYPGDWRASLKFKTGDATFTTIRTANQRVIVIKHDTTSPRPYSRINRLQGTSGVIEGQTESPSWPLRIMFDGEGDGWENAWLDQEAVERIRREHMHPLWKRAGELARKEGGHGGMDYLMDARWSYCLRKGLPLDTDVYDLATWCSVCELSERSVLSGSAPQKFPYFTRGAWKTAKPLPLADIEIEA